MGTRILPSRASASDVADLVGGCDAEPEDAVALAEELDDVERDDLAACAPHVTSRPSGAMAAMCSPKSGPPVVSTTTSTPRPAVASATAAATGVSR